MTVPVPTEPGSMSAGGQAVQRTPAVVEPLQLVAGRRERLRHLLGDVDPPGDRLLRQPFTCVSLGDPGADGQLGRCCVGHLCESDVQTEPVADVDVQQFEGPDRRVEELLDCVLPAIGVDGRGGHAASPPRAVRNASSGLSAKVAPTTKIAVAG
nr:hypothetical protein [Kribbella sp. VKM Ac-2527]